jgi:hypothetical protein
MRTTDSRPSRVPTSLSLRMAQTGLMAGLLLVSAGCQSMGFSSFKMPHMKEADGATVEDPWTTQAGSEGRAGRTVEKEADPLNLRRFFLSEKAMEIERNCGLE